MSSEHVPVLFCIGFAMKWCDLRERNKITRVCKEIVRYMNYVEIWGELYADNIEELWKSRRYIKEFVEKYTKRIYVARIEKNHLYSSFDVKEFEKKRIFVDKMTLQWPYAEINRINITVERLVIDVGITNPLDDKGIREISIPKSIIVSDELQIWGEEFEYDAWQTLADEIWINCDRDMPTKVIKCNRGIELTSLDEFKELRDLHCGYITFRGVFYIPQSIRRIYITMANIMYMAKYINEYLKEQGFVDFVVDETICIWSRDNIKNESINMGKSR
jgi:hypothetical protein